MIREKLISFVEEDRGQGDITTQAVLGEDKSMRLAEGALIFREDGVLAGLREAAVICEAYSMEFQASFREGETLTAGSVAAVVRGAAAKILLVERTLLNLMSRMSGIATATREVVERVKAQNPDIRIAATRKTAPGLGVFDKRAVVVGGGDSHRFGLHDALLIKDNHIEMVGGVREALLRAKNAASFSKKIEIEVETTEQAFEALAGGADIIMLDNMGPEKTGRLYRELKGKRPDVMVELSGGITPENVANYAHAADVISMGWLTHSVQEIDISLELKVLK